MSNLDIQIRTADRARKAEISLSDEQTCGDVIQAALTNWSLPPDIDYTLVNIDKNPPEALAPTATLARAVYLTEARSNCSQFLLRDVMLSERSVFCTEDC